MRIKPSHSLKPTLLAGLALLPMLGIGGRAAEEPKAAGEPAGTTFSRTVKGVQETFEVSPTFLFEGGGPRGFVKAIEEHYHADWSSVLTMPAEPLGARIPRVRLHQGPMTGILAADTLASWVSQVVVLYNQVAEQDPRLDKLFVSGPMLAPSVVMFIPKGTSTPPEMKVRAFPLNAIRRGNWDKLIEELSMTSDQAMKRQREVNEGGNGSTGFEHGHVEIHNETRLLVAFGSEAYLQMVESFINAFRLIAEPPPGSAGEKK